MLVLYGALRIAMKLLLITAAAVNLNEFRRTLRTVQKTHTHVVAKASEDRRGWSFFRVLT